MWPHSPCACSKRIATSVRRTARVLIQEIEKLEKQLADPSQRGSCLRRCWHRHLTSGLRRLARIAGRRKWMFLLRHRRLLPRRSRRARLPRPRPRCGQARASGWAWGFATPQTLANPDGEGGVALAVLLVGIGGGGLWLPRGSTDAHATGRTHWHDDGYTVSRPAIGRQRSVGHLAVVFSECHRTGFGTGLGQGEPTGSLSVTPENSTTYTLTAIGPGGPQSMRPR